MDTGKLSVKKIFSQDRRHLVPLFQRPYVWERERQWEPFWNDIRALAERLVEGKKPRAHFLGAIVLDQVATPTGRVETRLVIDGQQRLTTLQIFLEAFCDLCLELERDKHHKSLLKITRNDDPMSEDEDESFKVWPTNVDQEHFRRVMLCKSPAELRKQYDVGEDESIDHAIGDAYLYFVGAIRTWLTADADLLETRLDALLDASRDYVQLVVIDLDKEDDAQLIFETLNARGTPLLPSDLVKNYLFHMAQKKGESVEQLYKKHWEFFDKRAKYWRKELGRGHAKRHRIDTFLQHYLTMQTREEVPVAHLYVVFREYASKTDNTRDVLASIQHFADIYRSFDDFESGSREGQFFAWISALDITTALPVLLELFSKYGDKPGTLYPVLDDLESFLVRRTICQLSTRGYNRLFIDLLKELPKGKGDPLPAVRKFLLSSEAESTRWPKDDEFRQAWMEFPTYRVLVKRRVRMLLEALERKLRTSKSEKMELLEKLTIEHLLPQKWQKHWPLSNSTDELEQERDRLLHTIGNLTLCNGKLNPSVSNGPWDSKRPALLKHSLLRLNKELDVKKYDAWDESKIRDRGESLFKSATLIWTHPKS